MVFEYLDQDLRKYLDREQMLDVPVIKVLVYECFHIVLYVPNLTRSARMSSLPHSSSVVYKKDCSSVVTSNPRIC